MKSKESKIQEWASRLSQDNLYLISNALNEILNGPGAIEEWEFQTRTGIERPDAVKFQKSVKNILNEIDKQNAAH
jgi:hypothetical protein